MHRRPESDRPDCPRCFRYANRLVQPAAELHATLPRWPTALPTRRYCRSSSCRRRKTGTDSAAALLVPAIPGHFGSAKSSSATGLSCGLLDAERARSHTSDIVEIGKNLIRMQWAWCGKQHLVEMSRKSDTGRVFHRIHRAAFF